MATTVAYNPGLRMQRLEEAWPSPSPEQQAEQATLAKQLLTRVGALDVAPLLGLDA